MDYSQNQGQEQQLSEISPFDFLNEEAMMDTTSAPPAQTAQTAQAAHATIHPEPVMSISQINTANAIANTITNSIDSNSPSVLMPDTAQSMHQPVQDSQINEKSDNQSHVDQQQSHHQMTAQSANSTYESSIVEAQTASTTQTSIQLSTAAAVLPVQSPQKSAISNQVSSPKQAAKVESHSQTRSNSHDLAVSAAPTTSAQFEISTNAIVSSPKRIAAASASPIESATNNASTKPVTTVKLSSSPSIKPELTSNSQSITNRTDDDWSLFRV
jgi:hypothetical protein